MGAGARTGPFDLVHAAIMASYPNCALYHPQIIPVQGISRHNRKTVPLEPGLAPGYLFLKWPLLTPPGTSRHPPLPSPALAGEGRGELGGMGEVCNFLGYNP